MGRWKQQNKWPMSAHFTFFPALLNAWITLNEKWRVVNIVLLGQQTHPWLVVAATIIYWRSLFHRSCLKVPRFLSWRLTPYPASNIKPIRPLGTLYYTQEWLQEDDHFPHFFPCFQLRHHLRGSLSSLFVNSLKKLVWVTRCSFHLRSSTSTIPIGNSNRSLL